MSKRNLTRKRIRVCAWLVLVLAVCGIIISGYRLLGIMQSYRLGNNNYNELKNLVRTDTLYSPTPKIDAISQDDEEASQILPKLNVEIPYMAINFDALQAINADAAAWVYCPGTVIDYPIVWGSDYVYYLSHLPDGTPNANGTLFIDYNCTADFSDSLTIIYGHQMKSGRMFKSIGGYKKQAYYEEHPYMYLYTAQGNYRIDIMYGCVIAVEEWVERAFVFEENLSSLLAYGAQNTTFLSTVQYNQGDKVIVLSTCSFEYSGARYIVIGVLQPEYI